MRDCVTMLFVGWILLGAHPVATAQAAGAAGAAERAQAAPKTGTCRPKWPYIVLTCVA